MLRVVDIEESPPPGPHEVLVSVEASPLNKHDLLVVSGVLARPPLPHIPGAEGVARVLATGPAVDGLQVGDLVVLPLYAGAWRERLVVPADSPQAKPSSHPRLTQHATRRRVRSMRVRGHPEPQRGIDAGAEFFRSRACLCLSSTTIRLLLRGRGPVVCDGRPTAQLHVLR